MSAYPFTEPLLEMAHEASHNAFCPYSSFFVGAALRLTDGRTFSGSNVENVSFGLSICAERCAIYNAMPALHDVVHRVEAIAIVGGPHFSVHQFGETIPCGACLQVLAEFAEPECRIICADFLNEGPMQPPRFYTLGQLLPLNFGQGIVKR